jgi:hypothetical protein
MSWSPTVYIPEYIKSLITNTMDQNPSSKASACSDGKDITDFYGTWLFITMLTRAHHKIYNVTQHVSLMYKTKLIVYHLVAQCSGVAKSKPPTALTFAPLLM